MAAVKKLIGPVMKLPEKLTWASNWFEFPISVSQSAWIENLTELFEPFFPESNICLLGKLLVGNCLNLLYENPPGRVNNPNGNNAIPT